MSRAEISVYARKIRDLLGYDDDDYIYVPKLFDALSLLFFKQGLDFDFIILSDDNKLFLEKEEAYTDLSRGIIYIKESVMSEACRKRYCRATFTLIHELGHYLLHYLQSDVCLTRVDDNIYVPAYCDPEWQANTFASEFLMPYEKCIGLTPTQIKKKYHVSKTAAEVRYNYIQQEETDREVMEELNG